MVAITFMIGFLGVGVGYLLGRRAQRKAIHGRTQKGLPFSEKLV